MCEPISIAAVAMAGQSILAFKQQKNQNRALEFNAQVSEKNAGSAENQAAIAEERGRNDASEHRRRVEIFKGEQLAQASSSGVLVEDGSFSDILVQTAGEGEFDALKIRNNASNESFRLRSEATNFKNQSNFLRSQKGNPFLAAGSTLLSSAPTFATLAAK